MQLRLRGAPLSSFELSMTFWRACCSPHHVHGESRLPTIRVSAPFLAVRVATIPVRGRLLAGVLLARWRSTGLQPQRPGGEPSTLSLSFPPRHLLCDISCSSCRSVALAGRVGGPARADGSPRPGTAVARRLHGEPLGGMCARVLPRDVGTPPIPDHVIAVTTIVSGHGPRWARR